MTPVFDSYCALLLLSGSLVLLIGLLAGYPYGKAITRQALEPVVRAWRLAHSSLAIGGTTSLATGALLPWLHAGGWERPVIAWSFVLSGLAFSIALPYGAWKGHRGLVAEGPFDNWVVYGGNVVGAVSSMVGAVALVYAVIRLL
ncbi:MAG: hypothetical protein M3R21_01600 [Candidatus Dormibacteraeota bacterium]|nr:hypothetical protein [Candidatus Dormibacteraeota bacterium]